MSGAYRKFDLSGRTALVTGGGTGLGYYMARGLAHSGAHVIITARREEVLKEVAARLVEETSNQHVTQHTVDLADRDSVGQLVRHTRSSTDGIDIFVGNAAQDFLEPVDHIKDESIDGAFQVNVSANIELFRAFLPLMRQKRWGRVILCSSTRTLCSSPNDYMSVYCATKGAINAFTRSAALEVGRDGITVNSLLLGMSAPRSSKA